MRGEGYESVELADLGLSLRGEGGCKKGKSDEAQRQYSLEYEVTSINEQLRIKETQPEGQRHTIPPW